MDGLKTDLGRAGFTLIELMVAVALSLVAIAGVYRSFVSVTNMTEVQEQDREMLQDLRFAVGRLEREIRMAGYGDPANRVVGAGFGANGTGTAKWNDVTVTFDLNQDGDLSDNGERIRYFIDGPDARGAMTLRRLDVNAGGGAQPVIGNVDGLYFVYLDRSGVDLAPPTDGATASTAPAVNNSQNIRSVRITLVVRTSDFDGEFTNNFTYNEQHDIDHNPATALSQGDIEDIEVLAAQNDNYRRRLMTIEVRCPNMGL